MKDVDEDDEQKPAVDKAHDAAIGALTLFVQQYEPGTIDTADTFFTTNEIREAIDAHTGKLLEPYEIFELMNNMDYTYEALNGLEFRWLLRKE